MIKIHSRSAVVTLWPSALRHSEKAGSAHIGHRYKHRLWTAIVILSYFPHIHYSVNAEEYLHIILLFKLFSNGIKLTSCDVHSFFLKAHIDFCLNKRKCLFFNTNFLQNLFSRWTISSSSSTDVGRTTISRFWLKGVSILRSFPKVRSFFNIKPKAKDH